MTDSTTQIDAWLIEDINDSEEHLTWNANFEADRQVVISQLGPYKKVFLRPQKFIQRFYHTVYPLAIKELTLLEEIHLYDGFCHINATIKLSF